MTHLLERLELPTLQNRRKMDKLCLMYKITNNFFPAIKPNKFLTALPARRRIKPTRFEDSAFTNIMENQVNNNSKAFKHIFGRTPQYRNSFFPSTIIYWNTLSEGEVEAQNLDTFRCRLARC